MKVKIINTITEKGLEKQVNEFLYNDDFEIIDIKFSSTVTGFAAMIIYKE